MIKRILFKTALLTFLFCNTFVNANDVAGMGAISEAAGSSAQLRILGISKDPDNDEAAANVNVVVNINEHVLNSANGI